MDIKKIKELIDTFEKSKIQVLEVEENGLRVLLKKVEGEVCVESSKPELLEEPESYPEPTLIKDEEEPKPAAEAELNILADQEPELFEVEKIDVSDLEEPVDTKEVEWLAVKSPMVGVFHSAKEAGADPLVKEGDQVSAQQSLCVIEAMSIMNEIEAGQDGIVRKICKQDADPVEFGTVLFYIEPVKSLSV